MILEELEILLDKYKSVQYGLLFYQQRDEVVADWVKKDMDGFEVIAPRFLVNSNVLDDTVVKQLITSSTSIFSSRDKCTLLFHTSFIEKVWNEEEERMQDVEISHGVGQSLKQSYDNLIDRWETKNQESMPLLDRTLKTK